MLDLLPAARRTTDLITSVANDQLGLATPCPDLCLGALLDHVGVFAVRFADVARKVSAGRPSPPPPPDAANLEAGWRERIARDLAALAEAWRDPRAWEGSTTAGGLEMPAEVAGIVALDELVIHGWDIAVATGQPYEPATQEIEAAIGFVSSFEAPRDGRLFGPIVPVPDGAAPLLQLLGVTGRDPSWSPPA